MSTPLKADKDNNTYDDNKDNCVIPGYIQGSLLNLIDYDKDMLSEYGLKLAQVFQQIREEDEAKLNQAAKELDDLFEDE